MVVSAGYDLEDLSVSRAGRRHIVRVVVDRDGGISLDAVADVSRAVSVALDEAEAGGTNLVAGEYQLEVSSPGVDRPLTLPRHWRRNVGRLVKVTARGAGTAPPEQRRPDPAASERQVTGRVVAVDDEQVVLDLDGQQRAWSHAELGPGRVQVEFNRLDEYADDADDETDADDDDPHEGEDPYDIGDDEDVEGEER